MRCFSKIKSIIAELLQKRGRSVKWFLRYVAGGTATAALEMGVFFLLIHWEAAWAFIVSLLPAPLRTHAANELNMWAIVMSNITAYVFNYFVSKYWVFRSPDTPHSRDALLFAFSCVINLIIALIAAKLVLVGLFCLPFGGELWEKAVPLVAKVASNAIAFVSVLVFKRFIIWNDTAKY